MQTTTIGIDLAKSVFHVHGADTRGRPVFSRRVSRCKLGELIAKLPPCLIGMEACGSAHYWARRFLELGHTVRLISPQFVKPFVKSNKNDRNDAEAICEPFIRYARSQALRISLSAKPACDLSSRVEAVPGTAVHPVARRPTAGGFIDVE